MLRLLRESGIQLSEFVGNLSEYDTPRKIFERQIRYWNCRPGVQGLTVGTRVVFVHTWNTWREQIVCPVDRLVPVPDGLDDPAAATSYTNPLTAWALTRSSHNLKEGDQDSNL